MARFYGLRLGLIAAATMTLCTMTTASASANYPVDNGTVGTIAASDAGWMFAFDNAIAIDVAAPDPTFALPALVNRADVVREYPAYRPRHVSERASRSAVRSSSIAGWRSGRVRRLAG